MNYLCIFVMKKAMNDTSRKGQAYNVFDDRGHGGLPLRISLHQNYRYA